jgi:3-hydroxyacyl-CoA dehydrogenase
MYLVLARYPAFLESIRTLPSEAAPSTKRWRRSAAWQRISVVKSVTDAEAIDKTWRIATGAPKGPFQLLDIIGLTTAYHVAASGDEQCKVNARYLKEHYIDRGKLGRERGEGFYRYGKPTARSSTRPVATSA